MKLSRSTIGRTLVAALTLVCLTAVVTPAYASLEDTPTAESSTNPGVGDDAWREAWGNSLDPDFTFTAVPSDSDSPTIGFLYTLTRTPSAVPTDAYREGISWDPAGAMLGHTFDLDGLYADQGLTPSDLQGRWSLNVRFFNASKIAATTWHLPFGIDLEPPTPVRDFTTNVTLPTQSARRTVTWTNDEYDSLAGTWFYHLYLNDAVTPFLSLPLSSLLWIPKPTVTLEDLPPGVNKISIEVEDRATNRSPMATVYATVDPGWPELTVDSPSPGEWISGVRTIAATATDDACNPTVTYKIDGAVKETDAGPPYSFTLDSRKLKAGRHTFSAVATDLFGHARTVTRDFYVDNTPISISSMSDSPDPFYPIIDDGVRDTMTVKAYLGETVPALSFEIFDQTGTMLVRQYIWHNVKAGWVSATWNGTDQAGTTIEVGDIPGSATFKYRLRAVDRAGNITTTGFGTTEIRNYEIVPVGPGKVKVVPR